MSGLTIILKCKHTQEKEIAVVAAALICPVFAIFLDLHQEVILND